jgi:hypothetical protein
MTSRKLRRLFLLAALVIFLSADYSVKAGGEGGCQYCFSSSGPCKDCVAGVTCYLNGCNTVFGVCSAWGPLCGPG